MEAPEGLQNALGASYLLVATPGYLHSRAAHTPGAVLPSALPRAPPRASASAPSLSGAVGAAAPPHVFDAVPAAVPAALPAAMMMALLGSLFCFGWWNRQELMNKRLTYFIVMAT